MEDQQFRVTTTGDDITEATVILEPLRRGFGHTMGVALRRIMLTVLPGAAVTKVSIKGVGHQFSTIKGVKEDVVEFILNLKQLRIAYQGEKPETIRVSAVGPKDVQAKDLQVPATVRIANPELHLVTLTDKKSKVVAELTIESGAGYVTAEEQGKQKVGVIPVDASFSPVRDVSYTVESTRVGRRTDFDKLVIRVKTDGTIKPGDAVVQAAQILVQHFQQVVSPSLAGSDDAGTSSLPSSPLLKLSVEELDLPTRVVNALRNGGFHTVSDLVNVAPAELAHVKNIGQKSVAEILKKIREKGIDITRDQ